jgi:steroid 5-alpha reductase family enzyme
MSRQQDRIILIPMYIATTAIAITAGYFVPINNPLFLAAITDVIATVIIFVFSVLRDNSNVYDPYWSAAPIFLTGYWIVSSAPGAAMHPGSILIFIPIIIWSNRLTYNFLRQWNGFKHENWRYAAYRTKTGRWYWPVSCIGIHFFPTVIVFSACIPLYYAITSANQELSIMDITAAITALTAITIETFSDNQLRRYLLTRANIRTTLQSGIWKLTRHPNCFGEILFWWGMYFFVIAGNQRFWWTIFGPIIVTMLFICISIPLIEEKMKKNKPDYDEYKKRVSALIPWFRKK